jgi:prevent-host-death family protein
VKATWSLDASLYGAVQFYMAKRARPTFRKGAEEARNRLPELLNAAEKGRSTIITRHGRPIAALVPIAEFGAAGRQLPLLPEEGSGNGLWGKSTVHTIRRLRDEWGR